MLRPLLFALSAGVLLLGGRAARAQQPDLAEQEAAAPEPGRSAARPEAMGKDKAAIETYLKRRIEGIERTYKARMAAEARDSQEWNTFWTKVRDERKLFEVRIARQRLDLFESLASLQKKERSTAIGDFEKLQANVIKAFENDQRARMADFFAAREKRWRAYADQQERERVDSATEVDASWQRLKSSLKDAGAP